MDIIYVCITLPPKVKAAVYFFKDNAVEYANENRLYVSENSENGLLNFCV